jgi:lipopolysaccharide export LptBFGC system permease protein LptF
LKLGQRIEDKRKEIVAKVGKIDRAITGELHARMAFSLSVLVLVTLGAALAIVFRGAQVLVAFGISFVPSVLVVSLVIMGKQLIDKPATVQIGIAVIWLGLALVALLDVYVLAKMVRR